MDMHVNQIDTMRRLTRPAQAAEIERQINLLRQAVESINRDGHTILAAGVGPGRPFVMLAASKTLAAMADECKAAYYMRGTDDLGHWRKGQLLDYRNVTVTWMERGH